MENVSFNWFITALPTLEYTQKESLYKILQATLIPIQPEKVISNLNELCENRFNDLKQYLKFANHKSRGKWCGLCLTELITLKHEDLELTNIYEQKKLLQKATDIKCIEWIKGPVYSECKKLPPKQKHLPKTKEGIQ